MIKRYLMKPVEVEAIQWTGDNGSEIGSFVGSGTYRSSEKDVIFVITNEGAIRLRKGSYVVKGVKGEFYFCDENTFMERYEPLLT